MKKQRHTSAVGLIVYEFPPIVGGISRYLGDITVQLARIRPVHVLILRKPYGAGSLLATLPNVTFHSVTSTEALPSMIKKLYHSEDVNSWLFGHINAATRTARKAIHRQSGKSYIFVYGTDVIQKRRFLTWMHIYVRLLDCRCVIPISHSSRDRLRKKYPLTQTAILHPGISTNSFVTKRNRGNGIISVGRQVERKGFDTLIRAIALLQEEHQGTHLTLIGDGPEHQRLVALAESLGLKNRVRFIHELADSEVRNELAQHRVFCQLPRELPDGDIEGFGIVFLEAAAAGLPIVAGNSGGVSDAVSNQQNGFLVDPLSTESTAKHLRLLLDDNVLWDRMALASHEWAQRFEWAHRNPITDFNFLNS